MQCISGPFGRGCGGIALHVLEVPLCTIMRGMVIDLVNNRDLDFLDLQFFVKNLIFDGLERSGIERLILYS